MVQLIVSKINFFSCQTEYVVQIQTSYHVSKIGAMVDCFYVTLGQDILRNYVCQVQPFLCELFKIKNPLLRKSIPYTMGMFFFFCISATG